MAGNSEIRFNNEPTEATNFWDKLGKIPDPIFGLGGSLLSGLGSLFGGKSFDEKTRESLIKQLMASRHKKPFGPHAFDNLQGDIEQANVGYLNKLAGGLQGAGGMRSGQGIGELLRGGQSSLIGQLLPYKAQGMVANANAERDNMDLIARLLR